MRVKKTENDGLLSTGEPNVDGNIKISRNEIMNSGK
jgi:hypothetical protein